MIFGNQYKLVLLKKTSDKRFLQVKQLNIDITKNERVWRKQTYLYTPEDISYTKGRKNFIFKDVENGNTVLRWGKLDSAVNPTEPGAVMFKGLVAQAISSISENYGLITLIAVGGGLFAAGMFAMTILYPTLFPQMMKPVEAIAKGVALLVKP